MIAHFDCFSGASGDMILGALVDAGWDGLDGVLQSLHVSGWKLASRKVVKASVTATKVDFELDLTEAVEERHLADFLAILAGSELPGGVKTHAEAIFRRLADVEAGIHGCSVEEVHFHELGGLDTLLDVVGCCAGFAHFGFDRVTMSAIAVGSGTVRTAHGVLPVPAPATAKLLEGWQVTSGMVSKELTTPTGAAVLTHFSQGQSMPPMRLATVSYGAGTRDLDYPNVLRLMIGESPQADPADQVVVLETTIDDMSPELFPAAIDRIFESGALDAFLTPAQGKKGRPATLLTILAPVGAEDAVADAILRHTTTIGLRMRTERRRVLPRHEETVQTVYGAVRMKVAGEAGERKVKPEFEDCRRLAVEHGVPVATVVQAAAGAWQAQNLSL